MGEGEVPYWGRWPGLEIFKCSEQGSHDNGSGDSGMTMIAFGKRLLITNELEMMDTTNSLWKKAFSVWVSERLLCKSIKPSLIALRMWVKVIGCDSGLMFGAGLKSFRLASLWFLLSPETKTCSLRRL